MNTPQAEYADCLACQLETRCDLLTDDCLCPACESARVADELRWREFMDGLSWEQEAFRPPMWAREVRR